MTTTTRTPVDELLDRLALLEPTERPVLSLYLDTRPNDVGRDAFDSFLRKELQRGIDSYPPRSPDRESIEADATRIQEHVRTQLPKEAQTLALFACSAAGLFEALPLEVPLGESRLFLGSQPHLYPLARLLDQYRRYAVLVADTHVARVLVFGLGTEVRREEDVFTPKTRRTMVGGWSQMRYQRHVDNRHLKHAKEAAHALARVVREEGIEQVILSGEDTVLTLLREELPKEVSDRVIDSLSLTVRAPEHEILAATLEAFRRYDATDDSEAVRALADEYRAGGLAVVGLRDCLAALEAGQVDELVLPADATAIDGAQDGEDKDTRAGDLVARARRTGAAVRFIENAALLQELGGIGAFLRYRLSPETAVPPVDLLEPTP